MCPFLRPLAEIESESALNPIVVIRGIVRMCAAYFGLVTLAAATLIAFSMTMALSRLHPLVLELAHNFVLLHIVVSLMRAVTLAYCPRGITLAKLFPEFACVGHQSQVKMCRSE